MRKSIKRPVFIYNHAEDSYFVAWKIGQPFDIIYRLNPYAIAAAIRLEIKHSL